MTMRALLAAIAVLTAPGAAWGQLQASVKGGTLVVEGVTVNGEVACAGASMLSSVSTFTRAPR